MASNTAVAASSKVVVLLSLDTPEYFDEMYSSLIDRLFATAKIRRARNCAGAAKAISEKPTALLITDPHLAKSKKAVDKALLETVVAYTRDGGTVICMGTFSSFCPRDKLSSFFKDAWNLPWESGDYHRTDFHRNPKVSVGFVGAQSPLPSKCNMKALHLRNVDRLNAMYLPPARATTDSHVWMMDGVAIDDKTQTPVAFTQFGQGCLGYIGDVNTETVTNDSILAMCGLTD